MSTIALASGNTYKMDEVRRILDDMSVEIKSADELGVLEVLREDGTTFEENALQKARAVYKATGLPTIADDSGIELYFLNHRPGVYSARYAGEGASDEENNKKLLKELGPLSFRRRTARYRCAIAFVAEGIEEVVTGDCRGMILEQPRGTNGFGYDPLFKPDGYSLTFGELDPSIKHRISHRAKALEKIKPVLRNYLVK
jgi:XTP/dITP diphosphohydrolase